MSTLNPTLQQGVRYDQPVETPSAVGAVAGLLEFGLKAAAAAAPQKETASSASLKREQARKASLTEGLSKASALREQGQFDKADRLERQTKADYSLSGGDLGSSDTKALITTITGLDAEDVGFSPDEIVRQEIINTDEYRGYYLAARAANPTGTEQQWQEAAIAGAAMVEANQAMVALTKTNWNTKDGQASRINLIDVWRKENEGALSVLGEQNIAVSNDTLQAARISFMQLEYSIERSRPQGIDNSEWEPVQNALQAQRKILDAMIDLTSTQEITADASRSFISGLQVLVDEGKINDMEYNAAVKLFNDDPKLLDTLGLTKVTDIFSAAFEVDLRKTNEVVDSGNNQSLDEQTVPAFSDEEIKPKGSSRQNFKDAEDLFSVSGQAGEQWFDFTAAGLANLYSVAGNHGSWASSQGYSKLFNANFFNGLENLKSSNPQQYTAITNKALSAIEAHQTALKAGLQSRTKDSAVVYNPQTNTISLDRAAFEKSTLISNYEKAQLIDLVDSKYGGDFNAAIRDRGSNLPAVLRIAGDLASDETLERIDALNTLSKIKSRLTTVEGAGGDAEVKGGGGQDSLNATSNGPIAQNLGIDFGSYEAEYGLPSGYLERTAMLESTGNPIAENNRSSAGGLFQFIDSTAAEYGLTDKFDPVASTEAASKMASKNAKILEKALGRPPEGWELYLAHQQGGTGAVKLLSNPSGLAVDAVGKKAVILNGGHEGMSSAEFSRIWAEKYRGGAGRGPTSYREARGLQSVRPMPRPETITVDTPEVDAGSAVAGTTATATQQPAEQRQATPEGGTTQGGSKASQEGAQRVWGKLSNQTKGMLVRLFGNEEGALQAIADGEISEEDLNEN